MLEEVNFTCYWGVCRELLKNMDSFLEHVALHAGQVDVDDQDSNTCLWEDCGFVTSDKGHILRHINYHPYHEKLKYNARTHLEEKAMQGCQSNTHKRNQIPLSTPLICLWADCKREFHNVQDFIAHVNQHVTVGKCLWESCASTFAKKQDHRDHLRRHTGEKRAACPDCGTLFSNTTKLNQHCKRKPATPALHQTPPAGEYFQRNFFLVGNLVTLIMSLFIVAKQLPRVDDSPRMDIEETITTPAPATPALHQTPPAGEYFERNFFFGGEFGELDHVSIYCSKTVATCG